MLEMTLATKFIPGTNLSGNLTCADWRYLLPSLELDHILCVGTPSMRTLEVLSTIGKRIHVISSDSQKLRTIDTESRKKGTGNIHTTRISNYSELPFAYRSIDLIFLSGSEGGVKFLRQAGILTELKSLLKPEGIVYFEIKGLSERFINSTSRKEIIKEGFSIRGGFWLTPISGDLQTAVPLRDNKIALYFFRNVLFGLSLKMRVLSSLGKILSKVGIISPVAPRHAMLLEPSSIKGHRNNGNFIEVPEYISAIAEKSGMNLSNYTFGLNAKGKYNANKIIFFLFDKSTKKAEVVIKMTRAPEFNYRLENEFRVLSKLKKSGFVEDSSFPEPLFFDYHNNLAIIAIKAIYGRPFRTRTRATADCPIAHNAIKWLFKLGTASANKEAVTAKDIFLALQQLFTTFTEIYKVTENEKQFLAEQIETVLQSDTAFPVVFQHGDPGTWNMMVSDDDKVIVIDWEAGEPQGMPLWDLFYFFRTYASWVSRQQGSTDTLKNFMRHFLAESEINSILLDVVNRYCETIGLDKKMIKPLFYTCWMHRSLKEATRLRESSLPRGHFLNLLKICIREQNNPVLLALFE